MEIVPAYYYFNDWANLKKTDDTLKNTSLWYVKRRI